MRPASSVPQIGEKWVRANGVVVQIVDERINRGSREVLLKPVEGHKGRQSWKWDEAVKSELTRL